MDDPGFAVGPPPFKPSNSEALDIIRRELQDCHACTARQEARYPVPGVGNSTGLVFIGRNPGKTEDIDGEPFVGPSGRNFEEFLRLCGITRD